MEYIRGYLKIAGYMLCGLVFAFASFYLFVNIYHSLELSKKVVISIDEQPLIIDYEKTIQKVDSYLGDFVSNRYQGKENVMKMMSIHDHLEQCVSVLKDTYLNELRGKTSINIIDVYYLRDSYENKILSDCIINNLSWSVHLEENNIRSTYLKNNQTLMKLYVDSLKLETSYLKKDLLNNSSYYFNTTSASNGVKDYVRDGFYESLGAYKRASQYLEFLAQWFDQEVRGNF